MRKIFLLLLMIIAIVVAAKFPQACQAGDDGQFTTDPEFVGPPAPSASGTVEFRNPLGTTDTLPLLINDIKDWLTGIIAGIAVIMIMVGGFQYIWHSGNASEAAKAKNYIQYSVTGLILVLSVNMIISEINYLLGIGDSSDSFFNFAIRLIDWGIVIIAGLAVIFLMYAGYTYITVGADSKNSDKAKGIIKYSLIGLMVALLSYAIVRYIVTWFGA